MSIRPWNLSAQLESCASGGAGVAPVAGTSGSPVKRRSTGLAVRVLVLELVVDRRPQARDPTAANASDPNTTSKAAERIQVIRGLLRL